MFTKKSIGRFSLILVYVFVLAAASWYVNGKSFIGIDDANIYMVYMKNFSEGHGFVYNVGGERVEGFTSLFWTFIGSFIFLISSSPEFILLGLNLVIVAYTFYLVVDHIEKANANRKNIISSNSWFFLLAIGSTPGFIDWTIISLMETGLWTIIITALSLKIISFQAAQNNRIYYITFNILLVSLLLCRPESMLISPVFILLNGFNQFLVCRSIKKVSINFTLSILVLIITLSTLLAWRYTYFGYLFPNTYYAKVSLDWLDNLKAGIKYLYSLFIEKPYILAVLGFGTFTILRFVIKKDIDTIKAPLILFSIISVFLAIPLYSGGDHFRLHRFIIPAVPLIILLLIKCLEIYYPKISKTTFLMVSVVIFLSCSYNFRDLYYHKNPPLKLEWDIAIAGRDASSRLNGLFSDSHKYPSQGVLGAGGRAFTYKGNTIDLLGLNNTKMAHADKVKAKNLTKNHASFNVDVFFDLKPDLFWHNACRFVNTSEPISTEINFDTNWWISKVFKNIHLDRRFKERYGFYRITNKKNYSQSLEIFATKEFVDSLDKSIYSVAPIGYN
jgi:hypothetical protein